MEQEHTVPRVNSQYTVLSCAKSIFYVEPEKYTSLT